MSKQRQRFLEDYELSYYSIADLAERFGISRTTAYKWINRFNTRGQAGFRERSRRPHTCPWQTDAAISLERSFAHFIGYRSSKGLFVTYGLPHRIRTDNCVPFASNALVRLSQLSVWLIKLGIYPELWNIPQVLVGIEPGKPQQPVLARQAREWGARAHAPHAACPGGVSREAGSHDPAGGKPANSAEKVRRFPRRL